MAVDGCPGRPAARAEMAGTPPVRSGWDVVDKRGPNLRVNVLDLSIVNVRNFVNNELG